MLGGRSFRRCEKTSIPGMNNYSPDSYHVEQHDGGGETAFNNMLSAQGIEVGGRKQLRLDEEWVAMRMRTERKLQL